MSMAPKIAIAAGGTGGHVFPGIAVAEVLRKKGCEVSWIGRANSKESRWVAAADIPFQPIAATQLRGKGLLPWLAMPFRLIRSVQSAQRALRAIKADAVLTLGGYVSAPVGLAAKGKRLPLIVHEQNAAMGLTNRLLARVADRVLCAFPDTYAGANDVVGNPVRAGLSVREQTKTVAEGLTVAVIGGSQGAQFFNEQLPTVLTAVAREMPIRVLHQTGEAMLSDVERRYAEAGGTIEALTVTPFVTDMANVYATADLLIARAGAMTVSEVALTGLPTIFIPFPYAVDDHQTKNAEVLVRANGAELIQQKDFQPAAFSAQIVALLNSVERRQAMNVALRQALPADSAERVADYCWQVARGEL